MRVSAHGAGATDRNKPKLPTARQLHVRDATEAACELPAARRTQGDRMMCEPTEARLTKGGIFYAIIVGIPLVAIIGTVVLFVVAIGYFQSRCEARRLRHINARRKS